MPQENTVPQQPIVTSQVPPVVQPQVQATQPVGTMPPPPKRKLPLKSLFIGLGALLVILLLVVVFKSFSGSKQSATGEVVWWGLWEENQIVEDLISEFEGSNPGISVKYVKQSKEDYRERLVNSLAKGSGPDVFRFHNSWTPMLRSELDKMPATVYSPADFAKDFYPIATADLTVGSGIVGIPLEYDGLALYINEEIFEKSGKSVPITWNELRQTARELTVVDSKGVITQSGVALGRTENVDHWPEILGLMMLQNGADPNKPSGKLVEDALQFFTIFSKSDGVWNTSLPGSTVAFASGKVAMYFGPSWRALEIRDQNPNLRFKTVPLPQLPKTEANEPDVTYASYWVEGVWARSTKKEAAWKFLKFLSSNENLDKLYQNASKIRMFGEPYPKVSMAGSLSDHPIVGSIINGAPYAQSWFLQSRTWDGPTGINTQIAKYFEDAINAINDGDQVDKVLPSVSSGVPQVLSGYGIRVQ